MNISEFSHNSNFYNTTLEPLLKDLIHYVMRDESRHVAFGVLSLQEVYQELTAAELRDRQEFAFEAALRMRDRFLRQEVWERMGVDVKDMVKFTLAMPDELRVFQRLLFSKIVPNCKKLGLLDAGDGWLRDRFTEIGTHSSCLSLSGFCTPYPAIFPGSYLQKFPDAAEQGYLLM